jgi:hypothetical protein
MLGTTAIYLGRIIDKENFRAFIYGTGGQTKLVESWEEFEANMQTGVWFASKEDAKASKSDPIDSDVVVLKPKEKPRKRSKPKAEPVEQVDASDDVLPDDGSVFEVTDENN